MEIDEAVSYIMNLPEAEECQPFGPDVLVYKVADKMFATASEKEGIGQMNLKCDPNRALELRDRYDWIIPGYHMNKKHWNTVVFECSPPDELMRDMINSSFMLCLKGVLKKDRERIQELLMS